jgi:hypothetical protein
MVKEQSRDGIPFRDCFIEQISGGEKPGNVHAILVQQPPKSRLSPGFDLHDGKITLLLWRAAVL